MRIRTLIVCATILLFSASVTGCALTNSNPNQPQKTTLRQHAAAITDSFTVAIGIVDEAGTVASGLNIPVKTKDDIDCAIKRALGDDAPSAIVVTVCGFVPSRAAAPLRVAVLTLRDLTSEPSLKNTITVALNAAQPIWDKLAKSADQRLVTLGLILQLTLKPVLAIVGGV